MKTVKIHSERSKQAHYQKGRGAQIDVHNKFERHTHEPFLDDLEHEWEDLLNKQRETQYIEVFPKSLVNKVDSPDIPIGFSINPYQGCEHGCVYCYARNTHEYWGYNIGLDFETRILFKKNAAQLLEKKLRSKNWKASPIMLAGNTDCYQPVEHRLKITRELLKVFVKYKHPLTIVTKNSLVLRDLDLLRKLNDLNLVRIAVSITSLNEDIKNALEPKTASSAARFRTVEALSKVGIPVNVLMAPIIPSLTSQEIIPLVKKAGEAGANAVSPIVLRLNGQLIKVFENWVRSNFPDRAEKILKHIRDAHGGKHNDSRFGMRMRGEGKYVDHIHATVTMANKRYVNKRELPPLSTEHFTKHPESQLSLF